MGEVRPFSLRSPDATPESCSAVAEAVTYERSYSFLPGTVRTAAILTVGLGSCSVLGGRLSAGRFDLLIDALNRYPHAKSTAARWLVPALRNLVSESRETPEQLMNDWAVEAERRYNLLVHPHSARFQGDPPQHAALD